MAQLLTPRQIPRVVRAVAKSIRPKSMRGHSAEYRQSVEEALRLAVTVDAFIATGAPPTDDVSAMYARRLEEIVIDLLAALTCVRPELLTQGKTA